MAASAARGAPARKGAQEACEEVDTAGVSLDRGVGMAVAWRPHAGPQSLALAAAGVDEILFGGARGGGKTDCGMVWLVRPPHIDHPRFRALVLRRNYEDLVDWLDRARWMYAPVGGRVIPSRPARVEFPSGAVIRCGHLKDENAYTKYQGHEYQRLLLEEAGIIASERQLTMILGSVRSTVLGLRAEVFLTANPGGVGHRWLKERYGCGAADPREAGAAYRCLDGKVRLYVPATIEDNPTLSETNPEYVAWLHALPEPIRSAWLLGDWDIYAGQAFEWSARENIVDPFPIPDGAQLLNTFDWGSGKPFSAGWWWVTPDDVLVRIGEWYGCVPGQADAGLRLADHEIARGILEREERMGIAGRVRKRLADPTIFNRKPDNTGGGQAPSTAAIFQRCGVETLAGDPSRAIKFRQFGARIKSRSLLVFSNCRDFIRTVPDIPLDETTLEDVDTNAEDHAYDEACHAVMAVPLPEAVLRGTALSGLASGRAAAGRRPCAGGVGAASSVQELMAGAVED